MHTRVCEKAARLLVAVSDLYMEELLDAPEFLKIVHAIYLEANAYSELHKEI